MFSIKTVSPYRNVIAMIRAIVTERRVMKNIITRCDKYFIIVSVLCQVPESKCFTRGARRKLNIEKKLWLMGQMTIVITDSFVVLS